MMTAPRMSKTAALKAARHAVGKIHCRRSRRGSDYVFYAPYYDNRPSGPTTEIRASSYPEALARRTEKVAYVALALMGHHGVFLSHGRDCWSDGTTAEELVRAGIHYPSRSTTLE